MGNTSSRNLNAKDVIGIVSTRNYLLNPNGDLNTLGWATYADAAGTSPVDGTGGSPNVTFASSATTPLRGIGSFIFTKDAANRQGQGVSYDFTIDAVDATKVMQCSFEYKINSGTFADNDMSVWLYDITNAVVIQPAPYLIKNVLTAGEKLGFQFQASTSTSYRLILHVGSTSAVAYSLKLDNFTVGPQAKLYGSPITDEIDDSAAFTFTSLGTVTNKLVETSRRGDKLYIRCAVTAGTTTATALTLDFTKYSIATANFNSTFTKVGHGEYQSTGTNSVGTASLSVFVDSAQPNKLFFANTVSGNALVKSNGDVLGSTNKLSFTCEIPILGWSSSVLMSNDANTRVTEFRAIGTPTGGLTGSFTDVIVPTVSSDTNAGYNASTGVYTIQVPGYYVFNAVLGVLGTYGSGGSQETRLLKNGATNEAYSFNPSAAGVTLVQGQMASAPISCVAGDTFKLQALTTGTSPSYSATGGINFFGAQMISGPAQITASETVSMYYQDTSGTSFSNATFTTLAYNLKDHDTHGIYSGGTATIPVSGKYWIQAHVNFSANSTGLRAIRIRKNGTTSYGEQDSGAFSGANQTVFCQAVLNLIAGDTITIQPFQSSGGSLAIDTGAHLNGLSIFKVGGI